MQEIHAGEEITLKPRHGWWFSRRSSESRGGEHSLTQEIKVGSPVHAALDQFETVDMALDQSI
jgi:hypothetical protein